LPDLHTMLAPWFITGLIDAEGTFTWSISRNLKSKLGWTIAPRFSICLHMRDYPLLQAVQHFFGGIGVLKVSGKFVYYDINSALDLPILFTHLSLYPLVSSKRYMYFIFSTVHNLYITKQHLTPQGFLLCIAYINLLNKPIKAQVLNAIVGVYGSLPQVSLPPVPLFIKYTLSPYWILGFVCGEGSFTYFKRTRITAKGVTVFDYTFVFETSQLPLDIGLLIAVLNAIGPGFIYSHVGAVSRIRVVNMDILQHFVLPFFTRYPLPGYKGLQYQTWLKAVEVVIADRKYSKHRENILTPIVSELSAL